MYTLRRIERTVPNHAEVPYVCFSHGLVPCPSMIGPDLHPTPQDRLVLLQQCKEKSKIGYCREPALSDTVSRTECRLGLDTEILLLHKSYRNTHHTRHTKPLLGIVCIYARYATIGWRCFPVLYHMAQGRLITPCGALPTLLETRSLKSWGFPCMSSVTYVRHRDPPF